MIWCEKITLFVTLSLFLILGLLANSGTEAALPYIFFQIGYKLALPFWIFLRVVDLIFGGPRFRRRRRMARPVKVRPLRYVPPLYWG